MEVHSKQVTIKRLYWSSNEKNRAHAAIHSHTLVAKNPIIISLIILFLIATNAATTTRWAQIFKSPEKTSTRPGSYKIPPMPASWHRVSKTVFSHMIRILRDQYLSYKEQNQIGNLFQILHQFSLLGCGYEVICCIMTGITTGEAFD